MDASQWPQGMGLVKPMEEFVIASSITTTATSTATASTTGAPVVERRPKPHKEQALNCPRCNSTNTKFCYYNNYSLTQPRYLCKTCRRYWTEGGSLRNVPVGGGSRKNKRSSSFSSPIPSSTAAGAVANASNPKEYLHPDNHLMPPYKMPKLHGGEDLNLAFPQHGLPEYNSYPSNAAVGALSAIGMLNRPFFPLPEYANGFGIAQEFRPTTLNFPLDHGIVGGSAGGNGGGSASKMLFPMEELKTLVPVSNNSEQFEQSKAQGGGNPPGYWNGISW